MLDPGLVVDCWLVLFTAAHYNVFPGRNHNNGRNNSVDNGDNALANVL